MSQASTSSSEHQTHTELYACSRCGKIIQDHVYIVKDVIRLWNKGMLVQAVETGKVSVFCKEHYKEYMDELERAKEDN